MNKVMLIGRLTKDPVVSFTASNVAIAKYTLAVVRKYKKEGSPTADFINCVAIGKNGEFAEKYLKKGTKIAVEGAIQTGSYTNKDGNKVYTTDVIVDSVEFCESKSSSNQQNAGGGSATGITNATNDFVSIPDNVDLPNEIAFI
jgi:single-strand DNA-binding protein